MTRSHEQFEQHLLHPRGRGALARAPHAGAAGGAPCGDLVRIAVRVEGDRIAEAGFEASGCGAARAAGSAVVALTEGATVLEAARLDGAAISAELGGLSPGKHHAGALAADALHAALGAAARGRAIRAGRSERRTLVAMSGGVDSAVAALSAVEAGHEVVGVTLELWRDAANDGERSCCSAESVAAARALAHRMGIPHLTLDAREEFRAEVVDDFIAGYASGETPNPCVRCNGRVRFDRLLALCDDLGAARLATGHYARTLPCGEGTALVRAASDPRKDQSYVLARLAPADVGRLWFPLGELAKPQVRELARRARLAVAERPESQDLCFLSGTGRDAFLRRHGAEAMRAAGGGEDGEIVSADGRVLGRHRGHAAFTVGQRRGLGVSAGEPLYVLDKDPVSRRVTVGPRASLARDRVPVTDAVLHRPAAEVDAVRLRYASEPLPCRVQPGGEGRLELRLGRPALGAAPGQAACLLRGDVVVGCGTIARA